MRYKIMLNGPSPADVKPAAKTPAENAFWIGADGGCARLLAAGVVPDLAVGDFDSLPPAQTELIKRRAKRFLRVPAEGKDLTDFQLALDWIVARGDAEAITVHGWNGGRSDHLLSAFGVYADEKYGDIAEKLVLADAHNEVRAFVAKAPRAWGLAPNPRFKYVGFYAATGLKGISLKGFKYGLNETDSPAGKCWPSNEFAPGRKARVTLREGIVLAIFSDG